MIFVEGNEREKVNKNRIKYRGRWIKYKSSFVYMYVCVRICILLKKFSWFRETGLLFFF